MPSSPTSPFPTAHQSPVSETLGQGPASLPTSPGAAQASASPSPSRPLPQPPPLPPGFQSVPHMAPEVSLFTWNCPCPSFAQSPSKAPQGPGTNSWDRLVDDPGLGTYIAEGAVATQGPWLVVPVLLGILLTCGDRRATVSQTPSAPPLPPGQSTYWCLRHSPPHWSRLQPPPSRSGGWG